MLASVQRLLACNNCQRQLQRPLTLDCGHTVCAHHPHCSSPSCHPPQLSARNVLASGVAYYSASITSSAPAPHVTDVVLTNIIDLCARRPQPPDFAHRLLSELACHVCIHLVVDPVTTPCQHTFCADCLERSLDYHVRCPVCRQTLPGFAYFANHPRNVIIQSISTLAFPDLHTERQLAIAAAQHHPIYDTPIFRCNIAFPGLPTFLHIFEPRYRLMIRRCLTMPLPRFGMMMPSQPLSGTQSQPEESAEYGTILEIRSVQMFPDGRSMVEAMGVSRFRLVDCGVLDGYQVGCIETIDDFQSEDASDDGLKVSPPIISHLPTSTPALVDFCQNFLHTLRTSTAPWVAQKLDSTHGAPPDDPTAFSWWMASVLPIPEREKARLLPLRSAHARLGLIVRWIEALSNSGAADTGCIVV
ncbi:LON-domain-containing protein [Exidia glandulosa HHB12029]|uniref:LON-domain-containing protein n=1 Tax=Exidia glandulosa HHB12029 TaxID=1314781 RepID=A0A165QUE0_EXIGL|nr:LON-domain-containing protein [Exidia glandulosa HHB12029]